MKETSKSVNALDRADCWPTNSPAVVALELVDDKNRRFAAAINTSGVVSVIGKLLDVAVNPVFAAASRIADEAYPQCHINGNRLELASGRSPTEVAVTLTIGCVQMVVFLPLAEVLRSTAELARSIEATPPGEGRPH